MLGGIVAALGDLFQATLATATGIPGETSTSKYQDFMSFSRKEQGDFSLTNIYTVAFSSPPMLFDKLETGDDRILLELYGLYKQSIVGNINIEKPWAIQMESCAKWEAWNSCKDMDKETSMLKYINIVNMLIN